MGRMVYRGIDMEAWRYNFFGRLETWLDRRQQRAAEDGNRTRAWRYAQLRYIANTKMCREGCRNLTMIIP
jgi:hypothetical protein